MGGSDDGFDWTLAAVFGTTLGTTLLAVATGALAYSTWSDVRASWELASLTKRDQDARELPIVVVDSVRFTGSWDNGRLVPGRTATKVAGQVRKHPPRRT